ncbi:MAG: mercury methylation corrinoid protein HgcA [Deferrisomatales bacterium]|nr:mercury methylation corrinoid protein HgcA [Deferrisomatales bacterium]
MPAPSSREKPGYQLWPFVAGWLETAAGPVPQVRTQVDRADMLGRWQMRWGLGRDRYRIAPGLYAVGNPNADTEVLVTANYKMTFDDLRAQVAGHNLWILVLETHGINVWCAAGKGTFGTEEVVRRVQATGLDRVVSHRRLILPQLGAPGVAAHEVKKGCGFSVLYGPVRAADLPAFLAAGRKTTPAMRRVTFTMTERLVLTPVELMMFWKKQTLWILLGLFVFGGLGPGLFSFGAAWQRGWAGASAGAVGLFAGAVATPVLLPWLPGRMFALKGAVVGAAAGLVLLLLGGFATGVWGAAATLLGVGAAASFVAMNFTGASPYTSPSGVETEMRRSLPFQVGGGVLAALSWFIAAFG